MPAVCMIATHIAHDEHRALPQRRSHSAVVHPHAVRMVAAVRDTQISRRVGFQGTRAPSPVSPILLPPPASLFQSIVIFSHPNHGFRPRDPIQCLWIGGVSSTYPHFPPNLRWLQFKTFIVAVMNTTSTSPTLPYGTAATARDPTHASAAVRHTRRSTCPHWGLNTREP